LQEVQTWNTRVRAKRTRSSDSPPAPTFANITARTAASSITRGSAPKVNQQPAKKILVIGNSTTTGVKAAKKINLPKEVYRIGNIDSAFTIDHKMDYLKVIGVRVISCFDRTSENSRFADNSTFLDCILSVDKSKLLFPDNWSTGISIQKWVFRPKEQGQHE